MVLLFFLQMLQCHWSSERPLTFWYRTETMDGGEEPWCSERSVKAFSTAEVYTPL